MVPDLVRFEIDIRDLPELQHDIACLAAVWHQDFLLDGRAICALRKVVGVQLNFLPV